MAAPRRLHVRLTRDLILFCLGVTIIVYEVFGRPTEARADVLMLAAMLVGLPLYLRGSGL